MLIHTLFRGAGPAMILQSTKLGKSRQACSPPLDRKNHPNCEIRRKILKTVRLAGGNE